MRDLVQFVDLLLRHRDRNDVLVLIERSATAEIVCAFKIRRDSFPTPGISKEHDLTENVRPEVGRTKPPWKRNRHDYKCGESVG